MDVADLVAGNQEDGLIVESHGEQILILVLNQLLERLVLRIHIGGGVGGVDQAVKLGVLWRVRVGGRAGTVAVVILMKGVGGVADVPIHSAGAVGLVGGSGPQDGGQIALHQLKLHLDANVSQIRLNGGHQVHSGLVGVVIDSLDDGVGVPIGLGQQLLGLLRVVVVVVQVAALEVGVGRQGVGGDSRALEKSLTDGLHVNGVAEGLTDPDISQGGGGAVLLVELVEVEQAGIAHVDRRNGDAGGTLQGLHVCNHLGVAVVQIAGLGAGDHIGIGVTGAGQKLDLEVGHAVIVFVEGCQDGVVLHIDLFHHERSAADGVLEEGGLLDLEGVNSLELALGHGGELGEGQQSVGGDLIKGNDDLLPVDSDTAEGVIESVAGLAAGDGGEG